MGMLMRLWHGIQTDPTMLWVTLFVLAMFIAGVVSGFFRARKVQPGVFRWKQLAIEIAIITVSSLLGGFFLGAFTGYLHSLGWLVTNKAHAEWWVIALEYVAFFFLFDTWFYWWHRLMHIEPIYTIVHRWHHFSTTPTIISTLSVSPMESLINGGFMPLFTAVPFLLGMPIHAQTQPFIGITIIFMGLYVHSGFEFLPRWWNKTWATKWFITATFHDQHHQYFKFNYGGFTTIWDHIAGTVRARYDQDFEHPRALQREAARRAAKEARKSGSPAENPGVA